MNKTCIFNKRNKDKDSRKGGEMKEKENGE